MATAFEFPEFAERQFREQHFTPTDDFMFGALRLCRWKDFEKNYVTLWCEIQMTDARPILFNI